MPTKLKEKLIIGVIVCGASYVCFSPFIQLLLPVPSAIRDTAVDTITDGAPQSKQSTLPIQSSSDHNNYSGDIAASLLEINSNKESAGDLRRKFLQKAGLDRNISESTRASAEQKLKDLALAVTAGKNSEALNLADADIAFLNDYPGLDRRYLILAHTLAMQCSFKQGLTDKTLAYGETAVSLSRKNDDYMMNAIEPIYLQAKGVKADFQSIQGEFDKFDSQARADDTDGMTATAERLHQLTESLPEDSFEKLRADMYLAFVTSSGGRQKASSDRLNMVAKRAEKVGDAYLASQCRSMAEAVLPPEK